MSEETLTINSEEEKLAAINAVDDTDPDALEKLQKIQDTEIVEKEPEAAPESDIPAKEPENEVVEEPEAEPVEKEPVIPPEEGKPITIKAEELPEGYDTPGKAFKTLEHQKAHILKQDEQMEAMRQKMAAMEVKEPVVPEPPKHLEIPVNDYDAQIKDVEAKLLKQYDNDAFSPDVAKLSGQIVDLKTAKMQAGFEAKAIEIEKKATGQFEEYRQAEEQKKIEKLNQEALKKDWNEFDELGQSKDFSDYKMTKPAKEVEKDFLILRDGIVTAYYGRPATTWAEINNALNQYNSKAPALMTKLQALDVPTEYPEDVSTFLELYKVLNDRDGVRFNDNGEREIFRKRYDPAKGEDVADTFPSLKATIENQRVNSGHYRKKELAAYDKGAKATLQAQSKRDNDELQSDDGRIEVGKLTVEQMIAERDKLPNNAESLPRLMEINNQLEVIANQTTR